MRPRPAKLLLRLYPRAWRARYGEEFLALLDHRRGRPGVLGDGVRSAIGEHIKYGKGDVMDRHSFAPGGVARQPSAVAALLFSASALAIVLGHAAIYGVVHEADEGAAAHLWHLLMAAQTLAVLWFAAKWLPRAPRQAMPALLVQGGAVLANLAAVFLLT